MTVPAFFKSIRVRLGALILLAMMALILLLIYQEFQKHAEDKRTADANLLRTATFAARAERERFDAAQRLLVLAAQGTSFRKVAATPDSKEAFDACTTGLFVLDRLLPETSGFALWDTNGDVLCSSKGATRGLYNVRDRLWFQTARERQAIATGSYELAPPDDQPSLGFGLPIRDADGKQIVAYLSAGLKLDKPDDLLAEGNLPRTGGIGIVDQNGIIINSSTGQSGQPAGPQFAARFGSLASYPDSIVRAGNPGRRAAGVRITDAGDAAVTLVIAADQDALVTPLGQSLVDDLWPVALISLATVLAVWLLAQRWVMRPVRSLVAASDALERGDLAARAHVPPGVNEFEKLGASFNDMADTRERASHAKDEFLGLVSHELKTPITTMLGNAQILRDRGDTLDLESRRAALGDIADSGQRLSGIIDNLLALARLERGAGLESEPLHLLHMARASADDQSRRVPGRQVQVRGDRDLLALGGETYVDQVLENLIANAIKYSPHGSEIEVLLERTNDMAVVRVLDRGVGIDASERELIFEPFFRSSRSSMYAEGVGIGLSVCKRLTEAMGGAIWCHERIGGGSEFGFSLPLASDELAAYVEDEPTLVHETAHGEPASVPIS